MKAQDESQSASVLKVMMSDADYTLAKASNLLISIENAAPTVPHLDRVMSILRVLARQEQSTVGLFVVIRPEARPPSDAARSHIVKLFGDFEGTLGALAYVMEGEGFAAAAKRSVLTLIMATRRFKFPVKVFRTIGDAMPWIAENASADRSPPRPLARLVAEVQQLVETSRSPGAS